MPTMSRNFAAEPAKGTYQASVQDDGIEEQTKRNRQRTTHDCIRCHFGFLRFQATLAIPST